MTASSSRDSQVDDGQQGAIDVVLQPLFLRSVQLSIPDERRGESPARPQIYPQMGGLPFMVNQDGEQG